MSNEFLATTQLNKEFVAVIANHVIQLIHGGVITILPNGKIEPGPNWNPVEFTHIET